jgi:hypothetical protein
VSESFQVGEVAIYCRPGSENYGAEVTIVGPLKRWRLWTAPHDYHVAEAHQVDGALVGSRPDIKKWVAEPRHLRKKGSPLPPNREQAGEWDECPWQPAKRVTLSEE